MANVRRPLLSALFALVPAVAGAQLRVQVTEVATDTVRRGVFFELGGPGDLYSLNYQHHLRPHTVAQLGFTQWSFQFLGPRHATRAGIASIFRQVPALDVLSERILAEFGGGVVAGRHEVEDYELDPSVTYFDLPEPVVRRSPWLALNGLVGLRFQGINGGLTYRFGWTPLIVMRDLPKDSRWRPMTVGMSAGYTW